MDSVSLLAGIIQGEAGNPADQYGVASTIYNRNLGIGGFTGFGSGQGALAVATAPGQYSAYPNNLKTPTSYATQLATNLVNGNPPGDASTGNALYYNAPNTNPAYMSGIGNNFGPGTNQYSDQFNQPPSDNFQLPGGTNNTQTFVPNQITSFNYPSLTHSDAGFLSGANFGNPSPPETTQLNIPSGATENGSIPTGATSAPTSDVSNTPIIDNSGTIIGTEATIPPDTFSNFGAIDPTAGSAFGGAFDSSGNPVAGSSGIGGLGLPDSFAGGTGGGGLGYQVKPGKISSSNEAQTGTPIEIPDVANQINKTAQGINETLQGTGTTIAKGILGAAADAVTSAENWAGNILTRGGTMLFAIIIFAIAVYLLLPRGNKPIMAPG